jgi:hypothetical protein
VRHSARPDAAVLAYPVVSAHNDTVGTNGVAPFSMGFARFGNVGPATAVCALAAEPHSDRCQPVISHAATRSSLTPPPVHLSLTAPHPYRCLLSPPLAMRLRVCPPPLNEVT